VDGIGVFVVGTLNFHLLTRKLSGLLLVVQLIDGLLSGVEQNVLAAHFEAGQGTLRCALGPSFFIVISCDPTLAHSLSMISPVNMLSFGAPKLKVARTRVTTMLTATFFIVFLLRTASDVLSRKSTGRPENQLGSRGSGDYQTNIGVYAVSSLWHSVRTHSDHHQP
jgi:hypothetical protein